VPTLRPLPAASPLRAWNLLVLSDIHLGSDISDASASPPVRSQRVDDDLCALLGHYRDYRSEGKPWRLIINGDFIDFIGMAIKATSESVSTEPTAEERAHGLGTAEDHACIKLARVAARHSAVFAALAAFVDAGHLLTIVPGNHDREFHWDKVRADLRTLLHRALSPSRTASGAESEFVERIQFSSWFVWVEGVAYIEHGHQYDSFCATEHVMSPLSPLDPRRLSSGFSDVLLRFVVHPTDVVRRCDHDQMGLVGYLAMAGRLGIYGGATLARRFVMAIVELFRLRRLFFTKAAAALRVEHEGLVARLAESMQIDLRRLRAVIELQARPVTRTIRGIMASVLLDELLLAVLSVAALAVFTTLGFKASYYACFGALVLPAWWVVHRTLSRTRHVDPQNELVARAGALAQLFPAAFVVMGHTHVPVRLAAEAGGATYVNTGSWAEDEGARPDAAYVHRAARTHLVIRDRETGPEAELLAWDSTTGPKRFVAA
jgi:UDP-2,3-diacylglucosamine pyrophosphatase LpxH